MTRLKAVVLRVDSPGGSRHRQRDHPRRHAAREGEEAVRRLDGQRRRQRRILRRLRRPTRSSPTIARSPARSAWSAASSSPPTCGRRSASPSSPTSAARTPACSPATTSFTERRASKMQAWMDEIYGVFKGHVTDDPRQQAEEAASTSSPAAGSTPASRRWSSAWSTRSARWRTRSSSPPASQARQRLRRRVVPEPKNFIEKLLEGSNKKEDLNHVRQSCSGAPRAAHRSSISRCHCCKTSTRSAVKQIRNALRTLDMVQNEGVILTTPELMIMSK